MMALRFPKIVYNNKFSLPSLPPPGTFTGQSILITGATSGLGLATAVHFVNLGASSVIITGRSLFRSEAAKNVIEAQTSTVGKGIVKAMELDMSTFSQTKEFADKMKEEVKEINYVLLNAGCINTSFKLGKEGFEEEIQIHVLSTALLAILLLPWMKLTGRGKAHLGFVTSGRHQGVDIGEWNGWPKVGEIPRPIRWFSEEKHWPGDIYPTSKLLEQYVANEVAKLALGKDGKPEVIVTPMCPGMVKSDLARDYKKTNFVFSVGIDLIMNLLFKSTEGGARTPVLAALATPEENGNYYTNYQSYEDDKRDVQNSVLGPEGQKMQAEVWREVVGILEEKVPEVKQILHHTVV